MNTVWKPSVQILRARVFFDDRIANMHGAEMLGIQAVEFLNRDQVLAQFR